MNKPGRNDPCPCGSGKKYKHCCGLLQDRESPAERDTPVHELLQRGLGYHQAGHLSQAEAVYRQILRAVPNHPDALHLLGMVANQAGQNELAVELISKAIGINPVGPMYYNLGNVYHEQGKLDAAVDCFRKALQLQPDYVNACLNLGVVLKAQGKLDEAAVSFRKVLKLRPDFIGAYLHLGNVFKDQGKFDDAAECFQNALGLKPDYVEARVNLGNVLKDQGKLDEAVESFCKVLALKPDYAEAHNNLGNALQAQGNLDAAVESFRKALKLKPDYAEVHNNLGKALKEQGKLDEAIDSFEKALMLKPDYAEAHNHLGATLHGQGKLDEAIDSFEKALMLKPDYAEAHNNLGATLHGQGKLDEAIDSFEKALMLKPDYAEAHNNLGTMLHGQGKLDEAIDSFEKALMLKPDYAEAGNNIGNVFREQNKLDVAIGCYRKVLEFNPGMVEAYSNLGSALLEQGDREDAAESFRKALALEPDCINAHLGLGSVYQDTGQFGAARTHVDRVLALKPDHPLAWAVLPALRKMTPEDMPWAETAQRLLAECSRPQEEMGLCYALGKYHDDTRQYDAAFGCYARANALKRESAGPFKRDEFRDLVDRIIAAHPAEVVRMRHAGGSDSRRPVLIVGMPRSGTSLTEQILASHPDIYGAGELRFWEKQAQEHGPAISSGYHDAALLQDIAPRCEVELRRHSATALRVVDKMPGNFLHLGLIHAVFPQARILHTQRNPIDTCLSIFFQAFSNGHAYATDLNDLAFYYREYRRLMAHWRAVLPPEVFLDVPYEALVEDQEGWSRKIIEFIGLEWDERCLNFHETERRVGTASNWQVRQKIYKTSKERWRNYEKFVGPLLPLLELDE